MTRPGIHTADIFKLADLIIRAGYWPELEDLSYVVLLRDSGSLRWTIHRGQVPCVLPKPFRVWIVKGRTRHLLGDSDALPGDLSAGVGPPYT